MRFDGNSGVEVRPPSNLEDLKAYTSLSLFLQRPQNRGDRRKRQLPPNMFVMYLGNKDVSSHLKKAENVTCIQFMLLIKYIIKQTSTLEGNFTKGI